MVVFRRHAPNAHPGVEVVLLHTDAIAKDGPAREGTGRIGGDDANGEPLLAQNGGQSVDERALAAPRRTGDADRISPGAVWVELLHERRHRWIFTLHHGDQPGQGALSTGTHLFYQSSQGRLALHRG